MKQRGGLIAAADRPKKTQLLKRLSLDRSEKKAMASGNSIDSVVLALITLISAGLVLAGCRESPKSVTGKYQLAIAPSGQVYRIDTSSGEVTLIEQPAVTKDGRSKLVVGLFYETESGEVLHYVGKGKLEPRRPLSEIFK